VALPRSIEAARVYFLDEHQMPRLGGNSAIAVGAWWCDYLTGDFAMMLGLSLENFTLLHVIISLVAVASGLVVLFGMLSSQRMPALTGVFLVTTILTSVTGLMFPFKELLPSHVLSIISLVLLAVACVALYGRHLAGVWRPVYVVTALVSLYINVFVLVIQSFLKIPVLHALAPGNPPSAAIFAATQGIVLLAFAFAIFSVWRRFRPLPLAV
jgi:hypothetical protein